MAETNPPRPPADAAKPPAPAVVDARDLLRGGREVIIVHDGVYYRLRLTRRNKLILQK